MHEWRTAIRRASVVGEQLGRRAPTGLDKENGKDILLGSGELSELCAKVPAASDVDVVALHHRTRKGLGGEGFLYFLWAPLLATPHLLDADHSLHQCLFEPLMHHFFDGALEGGTEAGVFLFAEARNHVGEDAEVCIHKQRILVLNELSCPVLHPVVFVASTVLDADPLNLGERIDVRPFTRGAVFLLEQVVDIADLAIPVALRRRADLAAVASATTTAAASFQLRAGEWRAANTRR
jgi:hypothetical protein